MSRSFIKTSALAAVSLALLYYNVAWAVLRCPHQENHPDHEVVFYKTGSHLDGVSFPFRFQDPANLDCAGPDYHTELLAGPSTISELLRLTRDVSSRVNSSFIWSNFALDQIMDARLATSFDRMSSLTLPFVVPRYLSLSVFRL
jgi:hypothetical protein